MKKLTAQELRDRIDSHERKIEHSEKRIEFYEEKLKKSIQAGFKYKNRK